MRFDESDQADSSQVEDRRGGGGFFGFPGGGMGAGAGGLGVLGVVAYFALKLLTGGGGHAVADLERVLEGTDQLPHRGAPQTNGSMPPLTGSCQDVNSTNDAAKFIVCVETNVQAFWRQEFAHSSKNYQPARLVLFTERTSSNCGDASADTGPFYCPSDKKVYLDLGFFQALQRRFHARGGDFAEAYVVAHEYGHHVQDLLGLESKVRTLGEQNPDQRNALSVRLELQADCYAGVWGHAAYEKGKVSSGEVAQALDAAAAVGDDRIQKQARGRVNPETFTHGSSAKRQKWFNVGMESGDPSACNTFSGEP